MLQPVLVSSVLLSCLITLSDAQLVINGVVQEDLFYYGQSPAVYPSPLTNASGPWSDAIDQARGLVSQMSLEEMVNITGGFINSTNGCGGNIPGNERLGFPGMCLQDGADGVRETDFVNGYASGIHVGARYVYSDVIIRIRPC